MIRRVLGRYIICSVLSLGVMALMWSQGLWFDGMGYVFGVLAALVAITWEASA